MSKERTSISVDPEVANYLNQESVNASGLVNDLIKQYMGDDTSEQQLLKMRRDQLDSEIASLEGQLETKRSERERVNEAIAEHQHEQEHVIESAAEALDPGDLNHRNQKVSYWASEADVSEDELVELVREEWST